MNYIGREPVPGGVVLVGDTNPIGQVSWHHKVPDGSYLQLNGQVVSKTTYPDLWAYAQGFLTADQTTNPGLYRDVSGSTFALPKLDGLFLRATGQFDANRAAAALGVRQDDQNKAHTHTLAGTATYASLTPSGASQGGVAAGAPLIYSVSNITTSDGGTEGRPINVALVACVKALKAIMVPSSQVSSIPVPDYVMLESKDASASAQIDFVLPAGYEAYEFRLYTLLPATNDQSLFMRLSNDGGATFVSSASSYEETYLFVQTGTANSASRQATQFQVGAQCNNSATEGGYGGTITVSRPATGAARIDSRTNCHRAGSSQMMWNQGGRMIANSLPVNAVRFLQSSGNLTSGRIKMYGVR